MTYVEAGKFALLALVVWGLWSIPTAHLYDGSPRWFATFRAVVAAVLLAMMAAFGFVFLALLGSQILNH